MTKRRGFIRRMAILEAGLCLILTGAGMMAVTHERTIRNIRMEAAEKQRVWNPEVELKDSREAYEKCRKDFDSLNRYSSDERIEGVCESLLQAEKKLERDQKTVLEQSADVRRNQAIEEEQMVNEQTVERAEELLEQVRKHALPEVTRT